MRKLLFFMMTSANGFYEAGPWEIDWHTTDDEFNTFALEQLNAIDTILFGRVTFEGMASYWPTPEAIESDPEVAAKMNETPKIVFSSALESVAWQNSRLVKGDAAAEVRQLKAQDGKDLIIFGSSDLAVTLADAGLIDEYRFMLAPVALPRGKPVLLGLKQDLRLRLLRTRAFENGNLLVCYGPADPG
jgi:dihydrofolate reductase